MQTIVAINTHKLSLVQGVFVIAQKGKPVAYCPSMKLVNEWLDSASYEEAKAISISLLSIEDFAADDITHVIADDLMGDYQSYADFSEDQGYVFPWLEFWFDEITAGEFVRDLKMRRDRAKAINAPMVADCFDAMKIAAE